MAMRSPRCAPRPQPPPLRRSSTQVAAPAACSGVLPRPSRDVRWSASTSPARVFARGSVSELPFASGRFGAVVSIDVLCHRAVDPAAALAEFHRVLVPGGRLLMNLPAHRWLRSTHDDRVHTRDRFALREIRDMLAAADFDPVDLHHWNSLPFPALVLQRKVLAPLARGPERSDVAPLPALVDGCLRATMAVERWLLRAGLRLPFGGSVFAVARKPQS
jgi:SAM-dependent methyltransferase